MSFAKAKEMEDGCQNLMVEEATLKHLSKVLCFHSFAVLYDVRFEMEINNREKI